jgi:hypothetical protein
MPDATSASADGQTRRGEIAGPDEGLAAFEECRYFIAVQLPGN